VSSVIVSRVAVSSVTVSRVTGCTEMCTQDASFAGSSNTFASTGFVRCFFRLFSDYSPWLTLLPLVQMNEFCLFI
jgi:hypothetical protein